VVKTLVPVEGTLFDSVEEAYKAYKDYAAEAGFIVRRGHQTNDGGIVINTEFLCSKEGTKNMSLGLNESGCTA
uniref:FHY3/FAR1 family protein n=1 Tax=Salmonella enterica TaxID=28901 RepID=UPI0020C394DF